MDGKILPDTPWHLGYTKKEPNDPRRHKSRCIYLKNGECHCGTSGAYTLKCPGSSHCICYAETERQKKDNIKKHKSIDMESKERADQYRKRMQKKAHQLMQTQKLKFWESNVDFMRDCPLCGERFPNRQNDSAEYRECRYCGAIYHFIKLKYKGSSYISMEPEFLIKRK